MKAAEAAAEWCVVDNRFRASDANGESVDDG